MSDHFIAPVADGASVAGASATPATPVSAASGPASAPVVPVAAYEPPYYAVVFTSVKTEEGGRDGVAGGYGETNERMEELVEKIPGYLGMDYAGSPGGLSITVGYFRDADAVEEWRTNAEHRAAQKRGRAEWYERYSLHVAKVERSHGFEREHG
ncbi:antibiotic biosynthesis monooxygenase family protein [Streptomyces phaeochromogenes]|uniref:antibiotic biosynthesis monooxygenase family protein n=1 Tax=Streptomyces phaeochromogenes TaxID=1923 RepID=UPI0033C4F396